MKQSIMAHVIYINANNVIKSFEKQNAVCRVFKISKNTLLSWEKILSAYRRKTNTYAKNKDALQRVLDCEWIVHNFINEHATTKQVKIQRAA